MSWWAWVLTHLAAFVGGIVFDWWMHKPSSSISDEEWERRWRQKHPPSSS